MEALEITRKTLAGMEALLDASHERDILAAVKLLRLEVERMAEEEERTPGRYDGLAD